MNRYSVIGLMSGTSLDGLDIAHCFFQKEKSGWRFDLSAKTSIPYPESLQDQLRESVNLTAVALLKLNIDFGSWVGREVAGFMHTHKIQPDFIASHGHTVFHQIDKRLTYQIGSGQELANITNTKVICDFRTQDVLLGGQGAPLVPIGDRELFLDYDFCLNLGGIANMSLEWEGQRIAYDIGPANMLLNHLARKLNGSYDKGGAVARTGNVDQKLLHQLEELPYYQKSYPKSLGFEWFVEEVVPILAANSSTVPDQLHTSVRHIAQLIAREVLQFRTAGIQRMLCTGGGAKNTFLMEVLRTLLRGQVELVIPAGELIDFKEAIVFAFMGVKRLLGEPNCLSSVTGARKDVCGGVIYLPN